MQQGASVAKIAEIWTNRLIFGILSKQLAERRQENICSESGSLSFKKMILEFQWAVSPV